MLARWILSYGGFGLAPKAPGTFGTLGAALTAGAFLAWAPDLAADWRTLCVGWILVASALTVLLTPVVEAATGLHDPGVIVMDEVAGYWATLVFLPAAGPVHLVAAFFVFRFFDVWKPFPARQFERLPGGWGVLLDDVAGGLYGGAILAVLDRLTAPGSPTGG